MTLKPCLGPRRDCCIDDKEIDKFEFVEEITYTEIIER